jgi:hypothetical protein
MNEKERGAAGTRGLDFRNLVAIPQTTEMMLGDGCTCQLVEVRARADESGRALAAMARKYWMYSPFFALGKMPTAIGLMRNTKGRSK